MDEIEFQSVLRALDQVESSDSREAAIIFEVRRRIERLERTYEQIKPINKEIMNGGLGSYIDPATNDMVLQTTIAGTIRVPMQDKGKKFEAKTLSMGYSASSPDWLQDSHKILKMDMEILVEAFYYNAHRVVRLVSQLSSVSKIRKIGVLDVRNNLIEHDELGSYFTYGASEDGPIVKAMKNSVRTDSPSDQGLYKNLAELLDVLLLKLNKEF